MTIYVTGGSGLLGSEIIGLSKDAVCITSKEVDLTTSKGPLDHLKEGDVVIHCAAHVGGVKANTDFVADFFDKNVKMNMNVFEACKKSNAKLVSILSTCIYPDKDYISYPLTENQLHSGPPHPSNFGYAYAKRMIDIQTKAYRKQFGSNFITVIPNSLYGINDNYHLQNGHVIPSLIRKFYEAKINKEEKVVVWGSGNPLREFTFARDIASIILWLIDNYDSEEPINIGNPGQISIADLSKTISNIVGYEGEIFFDSTKPEGQYKKPSSNEKLLSLGWRREYTPLREGLKETIEYFCKKYPNVRGIE